MATYEQAVGNQTTHKVTALCWSTDSTTAYRFLVDLGTERALISDDPLFNTWVISHCPPTMNFQLSPRSPSIAVPTKNDLVIAKDRMHPLSGLARH